MGEMLINAMNESASSFDLAMMKLHAITEAAVRQLDINYEEADLKIMTEGGNDDDAAYLYKAANTSLLENIKRVLSKIKDAIIKFFSDMRDKILNTLNNAKNSEAIKKLETKIKLIPLFGRKKIEVENYDKEIKIANDHISKLDRLTAKFKSGQTVKSEEISDVANSFESEHANAVGIASSITMTISNAVDYLKKMINKAGEITKKNETDALKCCDNLEDDIDKSADPVIAENIAKAHTNIIKEMQKDFVRWITGVLNKIKETYNNIKKTTKDVKEDNIKKESTGDSDPIDSFDDNAWDSILNGMTTDNDSDDFEQKSDNSDDIHESAYDMLMRELDNI